MNTPRFDAIVIGAGAAGMMCASVAGQRGARVLLIDHADKPAEKIRISGGGRCNFTNRLAGPANFISENPHFCRSALARYTAEDFIALVKHHRIPFHEKHKGQLFCDDSSERIINLLRAECDVGGVRWALSCRVTGIAHRGNEFEVQTDQGVRRAQRIVVATGGLSIPKIGATDFGFRIARQFGHRIVEPRPALVPLTFNAAGWAPFAALAGVALPVRVTCNGVCFDEDLLFTHRGLSGPAILQISSFWQPGEPIELNLAPEKKGLAEHLLSAKSGNRQSIGNVLSTLLPRRLAEGWLGAQGFVAEGLDTNEFDTQSRMADVPDRILRALAQSLTSWRLVPSGSEGFRKAEVTRGGVATNELSQATLESKRVPGLYFIGEVVDITGWLGGYNFQWAWSSGFVAGQAIMAG